MALTVSKIIAYEILDSRGFPTLEARITLSDGHELETSIPSGTSIGKYEALELRDGDMSRFMGMGVLRAVDIVNNVIGPKLVGVEVDRQLDVDRWLIAADGTDNKSKLGANAVLAVSQLFLKAGAYGNKVPVFYYINKLYEKLFNTYITIERIPTPIFNVINGGKHANNTLQFQEFQLIPSSSLSFEEALRMGTEAFHELKDVLLYRNANISVGEEGGFAPNLSTNTDALELLNETIGRRHLKLGLDVFLGLDLASSYYYTDGKFDLKDKPTPMSKEEYTEFLIHLMGTYPFLAVEDPLLEDDFDGWSKLMEKMPSNTYLIGDDLLTTNKDRLQRAIKEKACTTILIKPNQIGTITETLEVVNLARNNKINYIVSHRSGETNDDLIADLGVGIQADFVKFGAPSRGERVAKYNRLLKLVYQDLKGR